MKIVESVRKTIYREELITNGDNILLAISGGMDSTVLLFILMEIRKRLPFSISLAHINHMLRGAESERDENFVRELARKYSLPIHVTRVNVAQHASEKNLSIQHAARELRYKAFDILVNEHQYNRVAVAHNMDDQVETFLLRAVKGTGIRGLSSIPIKRDYIIRPLLDISRSDITAYARSHGIPFVEDSSNNKTLYERNYLRKEVLPLLVEINPTFREKICNLLVDVNRINAYFEDKAEALLHATRNSASGDMTFSVKSLRKSDEETRFRVFSRVVSSIDPSFIPLRQHIKQIEHILFSEKPNLSCHLPHGIRAQRVYNRLFIEKSLPGQSLSEPISIKQGVNIIEALTIRLLLSYPRKTPASLPNNRNVALLDADKIGCLSLRTFRDGDRFIPLGLNKSVKLKDFYISSKIPKMNRRCIPLILSDNDIAWIGGIRIDERFKITEETKRVLKLQILPLH